MFFAMTDAKLPLLGKLVLPLGVAGNPITILSTSLNNAKIDDVAIAKAKTLGNGNTKSAKNLEAVPLNDPDAHDLKAEADTKIIVVGILGMKMTEHTVTLCHVGDPETLVTVPLHPDMKIGLHKITILELHKSYAE